MEDAPVSFVGRLGGMNLSLVSVPRRRSIAPSPAPAHLGFRTLLVARRVCQKSRCPEEPPSTIASPHFIMRIVFLISAHVQILKSYQFYRGHSTGEFLSKGKSAEKFPAVAGNAYQLTRLARGHTSFQFRWIQQNLSRQIKARRRFQISRRNLTNHVAESRGMTRSTSGSNADAQLAANDGTAKHAPEFGVYRNHLRLVAVECHARHRRM